MTAQKRKKGKPRGKPFAKGNNANPGGRPKIPMDIIEASRAHTLEAIEVLAEAMRQKSWPLKLKGADRILDRAWGTPTQSTKLEATGKDGKDLFPQAVESARANVDKILDAKIAEALAKHGIK